MTLPLDPEEELSRINRILRSYRLTPRVDAEQLAIDIWTQYCLGEKKRPTWTEIRSRMIDAYRRERVRRTVQIPPGTSENGEQFKEVDRGVTVETLMKASSLDRLERTIIHDIYYALRSVPEIAEFRSIPQTRVRTLHFGALAKLKRTATRITNRD